jgi:hypothetical protein
VDQSIAKLESVSKEGENTRPWTFKIKDGESYPSAESGLGDLQRVINEARNVENALLSYNSSAPLVNQLRDLKGEVSEEE